METRMQQDIPLLTLRPSRPMVEGSLPEAILVRRLPEAVVRRGMLPEVEPVEYRFTHHINLKLI